MPCHSLCRSPRREEAAAPARASLCLAASGFSVLLLEMWACSVPCLATSTIQTQRGSGLRSSARRGSISGRPPTRARHPRGSLEEAEEEVGVGSLAGMGRMAWIPLPRLADMGRMEWNDGTPTRARRPRQCLIHRRALGQAALALQAVEALLCYRRRRAQRVSTLPSPTTTYNPSLSRAPSACRFSMALWATWPRWMSKAESRRALVSFTVASSCLAILGYGVALAPKPPEEAK